MDEMPTKDFAVKRHAIISQPVAGETISGSATDNTSHKSRMRRTLERQSKRNILLMGLAIIIIIGAVIMYGQIIVIDLSLLLGTTKKATTLPTDTGSVSYIAPPVLNPVLSATNSATALFSGQITNADQVKLYINDELTDVAKPNADHTFNFSDIKLKEGNNMIKAVAWLKDKKSSDSNTLSVTYLKDPPNLTIDQPNDGDSFHGPSVLMIKGKTDPDDSVTINGTLVITKNDGSFNFEITLHNDENEIKVKATDNAGNSTEKIIKVSYSS